MATKPDPLMEALVGLAANAAPLIERARASGMFKGQQKPEASAPPPTDSATDAQRAALHEIIVAQAMKIHALEAELAALRRA